MLSLFLCSVLFAILSSCVSTDSLQEEGRAVVNDDFIDSLSFFVEDEEQDLASAGLPVGENLIDVRDERTPASLELQNTNGEIVATTDEILHYQVKSGETLMLVAFKIYGDYRMWKDLYTLNRKVINHYYDLSSLPVIQYKRPVKPFVPPAGSPYLIKKGEYLGLISQKLYGTHKKWSLLYEHNRSMIRFPDLIFAGFTLFYLPEYEQLALNNVSVEE